MSLSSFSLADTAIAQVETVQSTKTPRKRRTRAIADSTVIPEAR